MLLQSPSVDGAIEMDAEEEGVLVDEGCAFRGVDDFVAETGDEVGVGFCKDWFLEDASDLVPSDLF